MGIPWNDKALLSILKTHILVDVPVYNRGLKMIIGIKNGAINRTEHCRLGI
jgi:hypothetical protein